MKTIFTVFSILLLIPFPAISNETQNHKDQNEIIKSNDMRDNYIEWVKIRKHPKEYQKKQISAQISAYKEWQLLSKSETKRQILVLEQSKQMVEFHKNWRKKLP